MAYDRLDPFGEWRGDLRAAQMCWTMWRMWAEKSSKTMTVDDWIPKFGQRLSPKTSEEIMAGFLSLTAAAGGEIRGA